MEESMKESQYIKIIMRDQELILELMQKDKETKQEDIQEIKDRIENLKIEYRNALYREMEQEKHGKKL